MLQRETDRDVQDNNEESGNQDEKKNIFSNLIEYIRDPHKTTLLFLFAGVFLMPFGLLFGSSIMGISSAICLIISLTCSTFIAPQNYEREYDSIIPDKNEIDYLLDDDYPDDPDLLPSDSNSLIEGEDLVDLRNEFPQIQNYYLCEIDNMFTSNSNKNEIKVTVDTPSGIETYIFDYPYNWSESDFGDFAESRGYNEDNFHKIVGEYVFVKYEDDNTSHLVLDEPIDLTEAKIEDNEWSSNDGNFEALEVKLDVEFDNVATGEEIVVDDSSFDLSDSR